MTVAVETKPKPIPTRDDIEDRFKWNLKDIYQSDSDWEEHYRKAQSLIEKAKEFAGKLASSAETLYTCLETRTELALVASHLYQYARLSQDLDNRVSKYQAMTDRAAMLSAQAGAAFAFVEPELLTIDEATLRQLAAQFPKTDVYDHYIDDLIRSRAHVRSHEVEELLAQSSLVARGPENIFTMLDDADLKYPSVKDEQGNAVTLSKQRFAKFVESSDRRVRREAHEGFYSAYKDHLNTLGASLSTAINADVFYCRARRFESCLHASLWKDNIPVDVYRSLLDTTEANLHGLHRYVSLRQRILKLDKLYPYDMVCPLFPEKDYEVKYDGAIDKILQAIRPLGNKYGEVLRSGFQTRWVDVFETEGKGGGAYSWGNYSVHPFVLMNYNDTVDNMFTLAHEMGHALHSHLSNSTQPFAKAQYSIFLAEVASTLNEGLLLHYLLRKATDLKERLYLLNRYIDNTVGTFFNQVMYARFELAIHEHVEKGGALSPEWLTNLWRDLAAKYYGPSLQPDDYSPLKWSRVPHFYMTYYVYQYATSYAASQAILSRLLAGEAGLVDRYLKMLSAGGSDYPIELLKICDIDMITPAPVEATLTMFGEKVEELGRLASR
ncbi:MAG TPA: oligoendopeptidase F [Candidatus Deferrimicrobium sp.]|nr:oligoendopeptidase F [Candidatus Deferrimicrobium sp.]